MKINVFLILLGSNAACYGNLNYILSFVTAGPAIKFFALPISPKAAPKCISKEFNMHLIQDKIEVLVAFVNMCRWCCTIQGIFRISDLFLP